MSNNFKELCNLPEYELIELFPSYVSLSGGIICNLMDRSSEQTPDFVCGAFSVYYEPIKEFKGKYIFDLWTQRFGMVKCSSDEDPRKYVSSILVYHWNGSNWEKHVIKTGYAMEVGKDTADISGNGRADIVFAEWKENTGWLKGKVNKSGGIYWLEAPEYPYSGEEWQEHLIDDGIDSAHDIICGDINNDGKTEIVVRNLNRSINCYFMGGNPHEKWERLMVTEFLPGDGTALYDITGTGSLDIITGRGYFENVNGDGRSWQYHSFNIEHLGLHPENRVAVTKLNNDGSLSVVITESEVESRILIVTTYNKGKSWDYKILAEKELGYESLHSLRVFGPNEKGLPDIFVVEMEFSKTDGITSKPKWIVLENKGDFCFEQRVILDENIGAHLACVGKIQSKNKFNFIGNDWASNYFNGLGGNNHIVILK